MSEVETVPQRYRARGKDFDSEDEAKTYALLRDAEDAYKEAEGAWKRCLARTQKTADGRPFKGYGSLYRVNDLCGSLPSVEEVTIRLRHCEVDTDRPGEVVFHEWCHRARGAYSGDHFRVEYRISELYAVRRNAERACLELMRERHAQNAETIADFAQRRGIE